jgi:hypothetical protein
MVRGFIKTIRFATRIKMQINAEGAEKEPGRGSQRLSSSASAYFLSADISSVPCCQARSTVKSLKTQWNGIVLVGIHLVR